MTDNYQAVYDAVRSRFSNFDGRFLTEEIVHRFDFSHQAEIIKQDFLNVSYEMQRPSVLFKPRVFMDGNSWCALLGDDMQNGVVGFGNSPEEATVDFDIAWYKKIEPIADNKEVSNDNK